MTEAGVVDFFNLSLLAEVAAGIKEQEYREKEKHAGVTFTGTRISRKRKAIKVQQEEEEEETRRRRRRQVMATKKRNQEHLHMMPCNSKKIMRSPTSSSDHHDHGWIEAHVRMRASPPIWICDKRLTDCDTRPHQNRLLLGAASIKDMLIPHLSENQKYQLLGGAYTLEEDEEHQQQNKEGLKVVIIDGMGGQWNNMWLKQWATGNYALKGEWTKMVEKNRFVGGQDTVRVFAFKYGAGRASEDQHLGLVVARPAPVL